MLRSLPFHATLQHLLWSTAAADVIIVSVWRVRDAAGACRSVVNKVCALVCNTAATLPDAIQQALWRNQPFFKYAIIWNKTLFCLHDEPKITETALASPPRACSQQDRLFITLTINFIIAHYYCRVSVTRDLADVTLAHFIRRHAGKISSLKVQRCCTYCTVKIHDITVQRTTVTAC